MDPDNREAGGVNFTAGLVIALFFLQRGDLRFGEDNAVAADLGCQGAESIFKVGQGMAQPDAEYPTAGNKDPAQAQLVAGTVLSVGRKATAYSTPTASVASSTRFLRLG